MEHNYLLQALGMLATAIIGSVGTWFFGKRSGTGFLMGQGRSRLSTAVGRSNNRDNNETNAENIVLASAKLSQEELVKSREWLNTTLKEFSELNYRLGKAEAKAEILEKQTSAPEIANDLFTENMTPNSTFPEAAEAFSQGTAEPSAIIPETPSGEAEYGIEALPKEQRRKHLLLEDKNTPKKLTKNDEYAEKADWNLPIFGDGGVNAEKRTDHEHNDQTSRIVSKYAEQQQRPRNPSR